MLSKRRSLTLLFVVSLTLLLSWLLLVVPSYALTLVSYFYPAQLDGGYIHVCPNQDRIINITLCNYGTINGFIDDNGRRFIPNGLNTPLAWYKTPRVTIDRLENTNYEVWLQKLKRKGINSIHLRLDTIVATVGVVHMQPPPLGYYYIADDYPMDAVWLEEWLYSNYNQESHTGALINGDDFLTHYPACRYPHFTIENCGPTYAAKFSNSLITKIIQAAEKNQVKVSLTFWGSEQYNDETKWAYSAYNRVCRRPDRSVCAATEAGILTDKYDIIFDPQGHIPGSVKNGKNVLDYQQQYIDFVYQAWGESPAIWMWEIMNEIHYLGQWNSTPGEEVDENVDKRLLPWVNYTANYLRAKDIHHRPISISSLQPSWVDGTIADPRLIISSAGNLCDQNAWQGSTVDFFLACKHKMFEYVDVVNVHDYRRHTLKSRLDLQKRLDDIWPDKPKIIGEFLPGQCDQPDCQPPPRNKADPIVLAGQYIYLGQYPWHIEIAPFQNSIAYYWLSLIANGGNGEVRRWMGFGLESWQAGAAFNFRNEYGNEHYSDIAVPTGKFISAVNWANWRQHRSWDQNITIANTGLDPLTDFVFVSRGDGDQVMLMFRSLSENGTPIEIRNLAEGVYTVTLFDWLTGEAATTQTVKTVNHTVTINVDVRWVAQDWQDLTWDVKTKRFVGNLVERYTTDYTNPLGPNLGNDWPRLILSDSTPGHENEAINRLRRNIGIVLVEKARPQQ